MSEFTWGALEVVEDTPQVLITKLSIKPGCETQLSNNAYETQLYLLSGKCDIVTIYRDISENISIDKYIIGNNVKYKIVNPYDIECVILEIKKINSRPFNKYDHLPNDIISIIDKLISYKVDYNNEYYDVTLDTIMKEIEMLPKKHIVSIDSENRQETKGIKYDPYLADFILGSGGQLTTWSKTENSNTPVVLRGLGKRKMIKSCQETGRTFYYIDTGYFGNGRKKIYHRITQNALQAIGPVIHRRRDRLAMAGWNPRKFTPGKNILVCPPSNKVMVFFNLDLEKWIADTVAEIKKHTDRPIIIREKQGRSTRVTTDTMEMALANDVHCLVTFNSIAATEAILLGKPAFTLGPNAAQSVSNLSLDTLENPFIPTLDQVEEWASHLAYCQFTQPEMANGTAWRILNESSNLLSSRSE